MRGRGKNEFVAFAGPPFDPCYMCPICGRMFDNLREVEGCDHGAAEIKEQARD